MALADAVQGGIRPSQQITWADEDGTALDLTGATITGLLRNRNTKATRAIAGGLTPDPDQVANKGQFTWAYHTNDVAENGTFDVQFNAEFGSAPTPAKSFVSPWNVRSTLVLSA